MGDDLNAWKSTKFILNEAACKYPSRKKKDEVFMYTFKLEIICGRRSCLMVKKASMHELISHKIIFLIWVCTSAVGITGLKRTLRGASCQLHTSTSRGRLASCGWKSCSDILPCSCSPRRNANWARSLPPSCNTGDSGCS